MCTAGVDENRNASGTATIKYSVLPANDDVSPVNLPVMRVNRREH